jgi:parallel beta-helix repeat protein
MVIYGESNNQIDDNKIYDNKAACISIRSNASNTRVTNNACWQNSRNIISNEGTNTTLSNNLFTAPDPGSVTSPVATIPSAPVSLKVAP